MVHFDGKASRKLGGHADCCDNCRKRFMKCCRVYIDRWWWLSYRLKLNVAASDDTETTTHNYGKEAELLLELIRVKHVLVVCQYLCTYVRIGLPCTEEFWAHNLHHDFEGFGKCLTHNLWSLHPELTYVLYIQNSQRVPDWGSVHSSFGAGRWVYVVTNISSRLKQWQTELDAELIQICECNQGHAC